LHENPLLPNARLREMYKLMQRTAALRKRSNVRDEALLCATAMHLAPGDFAMPLPGDTVAHEVVAQFLSLRKKRNVSSAVSTPMPSNRAHLAAGIAQGLLHAHSDRLAAIYVNSGTARQEAGWSAALTYAQQNTLPLLMIVADTGPRVSGANALTLATISRMARPLHLPVVTVDGADAVAIYRVMQESVLRTRQGGGPAVLWCLLDAAAASPAGSPVARMAAYLKARKLLR
jgi:hypothetical protein